MQNFLFPANLKPSPVVGPKIMEEVMKAKKGIQESKDLYHESYLTKLPDRVRNDFENLE